MNIGWKKLVVVVVSILVIVGISFILMCLEKKRMLKNTELIIHGSTMGTYYDIRVVMSELEKHKVDVYELKDKIDKKLLSIEKIASSFREDSELSYINANKSNSWIKISEALYILIKEAEAVSINTNGRYDITVGNLMRLWNFNKGRTFLVDKIESIPSDFQIKEVLKTVGYKKIKLKKENEVFYLKKLNKDINIDLSSIAKGYGLDKVSKLLMDLSYKNHKVEIGGEVVVKGKNIDSKNWRIGIEKPHLNNVEDFHIIEISDIAVATSGSYRNYYQYGGKIYTHIMDPVKGRPIENKVISVSVLGANCMFSDALATALFSMNVEEGLELAKKLSIPVYYMYLGEDNKLFEKWNEEFDKYLVKK